MGISLARCWSTETSRPAILNHSIITPHVGHYQITSQCKEILKRTGHGSMQAVLQFALSTLMYLILGVFQGKGLDPDPHNWSMFALVHVTAWKDHSACRKLAFYLQILLVVLPYTKPPRWPVFWLLVLSCRRVQSKSRWGKSCGCPDLSNAELQAGRLAYACT